MSDGERGVRLQNCSVTCLQYVTTVRYAFFEKLFTLLSFFPITSLCLLVKNGTILLFSCCYLYMRDAIGVMFEFESRLVESGSRNWRRERVRQCTEILEMSLFRAEDEGVGGHGHGQMFSS